MKCYICERGCEIPEGGTGACGMYLNQAEEITERFPNKYLITTPISVETMPVLHFYPGGKFLQISTAGCNFDCDGCISTVIVREMAPGSRALRELSQEQVVEEALRSDCQGIAFLMNDPLASLLSFAGVARAAKKHGLLVGCSSNAYFTDASLDLIIDNLDFINIGFKGLTAGAYRKCGGHSAEPVLRNIKRLHDSGVHVEVSCIHTQNNREEIVSLARKLAEISIDLPLQVMRFLPVEKAEPHLEPAIRDSEQLCRSLSVHLSYVYLFNSPGTEHLNTFCPRCGFLIYKREFYGPMGARLKRPVEGLGLDENNRCPSCKLGLSFKGSRAPAFYQEGDFEGGYPFTRALEMVESVLITMGISKKDKVALVWEDVICRSGLPKLHRDLQNPGTFVGMIRYFGKLIQEEGRAEKLAVYMEEKIDLIKAGLTAVKNKPRVYYAMGKPNFCIKGGRLENQLIETAGGVSVNKEISGSGRPGMNITYEQLESLNPEVIFISSFISSSVEDFYKECAEAGIDIEAVRNTRVYSYPAPCWDFGSPRWILGLMYIANVLHPEIFHFDLIKEAQMFYREFYNLSFDLSDLNRSFSKPSSKWGWQ